MRGETTNELRSRSMSDETLRDLGEVVADPDFHRSELGGTLAARLANAGFPAERLLLLTAWARRADARPLAEAILGFDPDAPATIPLIGRPPTVAERIACYLEAMGRAGEPAVERYGQGSAALARRRLFDLLFEHPVLLNRELRVERVTVSTEDETETTEITLGQAMALCRDFRFPCSLDGFGDEQQVAFLKTADVIGALCGYPPCRGRERSSSPLALALGVYDRRPELIVSFWELGKHLNFVDLDEPFPKNNGLLKSSFFNHSKPADLSLEVLAALAESFMHACGAPELLQRDHPSWGAPCPRYIEFAKEERLFDIHGFRIRVQRRARDVVFNALDWYGDQASVERAVTAVADGLVAAGVHTTPVEAARWVCSLLHEVPLLEREAGKTLSFLRALDACGVRLTEVDLHPKASKAEEFRTRFPQWTLALEIFGRETAMADVLRTAAGPTATAPSGARRRVTL